jgi:signal transduction histidine kinase
MSRRSRTLRSFWILAPLATGALAWSSFKALERERATNVGRAFWGQHNDVGSIVTDLDHVVGNLLLREDAYAIEDYASYRELAGAIPTALLAAGGVDPAAPLPAVEPTAVPSPFFGEAARAGLATLHFQLSARRGLTLPAAPTGTERTLALAFGHTTAAAIAETEALAAQLETRLGTGALRKLVRTRPLLATLAGASKFRAFFLEGKGETGKPTAELLALRLTGPSGEPPVLQGVWLDWPHLRSALQVIAESYVDSDEISLTPAPELLAGGLAAPPARKLITNNGGRLARLALDVRIGGHTPHEPPLWTETARSLAAAWAVFLAALAAIHFSLRRAAALSERRARFASAVTHELRTPLTTLCMYAEMLRGGLVPEDQLDDYYATLEREAGRLAALVDNVLDHAGLESGRAAALEPLELAAWLADQVSRLTIEELELAPLPSEPLWITADAFGLERILTNLVQNAARHGRPPIHVELGRRGTRAELRVRDAGDGIPHSEAIFEPFSRGTGPTPGGSSSRGLGLGLALSRDLAHAMGAELELEHPGPGAVTNGKTRARDATPTTFLLSLPLSAPAG